MGLGDDGGKLHKDDRYEQGFGGICQRILHVLTACTWLMLYCTMGVIMETDIVEGAANATAPAQIIRVVDYGARPDDGSNAVPGITAAFAAARRLDGAPAVIQFAPGRYRCAGGKAQPDGRTHAPSFDIPKLANVTIEGNGATLVGGDIARLFLIRDAQNITIRQLTVDWDPLPYTAGRVVGLLPAEHAFDIAPQIPPDARPGRIVQGILAYNPERHRLADNGWEIYQTQGERDADPTQRTPAGNLRIFQARGNHLPEVGWQIIARHQVYGYDAFTFAGCQNVLLEDVTIHAVPGMAVIGWQSRDITIRRLKVIPSAGGWMSATADAMHFNGCRGRITVEDSEFAGMGDDAINIHAMYGLVTARLDDHTLAVGRARMNPYYDKTRGIWDAPVKGDILEFSGGDEPLLARGQLIVAGARQDAGQQRTIITFTDTLPADVGANTVLSNLSTSPSVRIRRCYVYGNRARGMLLQSRDVLLEDCVFEDISGAGLHICTDAVDWWESLGARDVTVQRCVFRRCNFGVARREAALDIFSDLPHGRQSAAGIHQRLHLLDNLFDGNTGAAIHVGSSEDVEIRGNRFILGDAPAIIVMNSRQVTIAGNTRQGGRGVEIRGNSDRNSINVEDE